LCTLWLNRQCKRNVFSLGFFFFWPIQGWCIFLFKNGGNLPLSAPIGPHLENQKNWWWGENCVTWHPMGPTWDTISLVMGEKNVFKTTHWASFGQKNVKWLTKNCATWSPNAHPLPKGITKSLVLGVNYPKQFKIHPINIREYLVMGVI